MWDARDQNGGRREFALLVSQIVGGVAMNHRDLYTYLEKMSSEFQTILESRLKNG